MVDREEQGVLGFPATSPSVPRTEPFPPPGASDSGLGDETFFREQKPFLESSSARQSQQEAEGEYGTSQGADAVKASRSRGVVVALDAGGVDGSDLDRGQDAQ